MCFVYLEKAFDRVPRKVLEWAMRKKGIPPVFLYYLFILYYCIQLPILVTSVISLYEGAKMRVGVDSELSYEFDVKMGMYQRSVLTVFLFGVLVDVVSEFGREGAQSELVYTDDLILMSERIEGLRNKFIK